MTSSRTPRSTEAIDAFRFLVDELGFRVAAKSDDLRESYVTFESDRVRVAVAMDFPPAVFVTVVDRATGEPFALAVVVRASRVQPSADRPLARTSVASCEGEESRLAPGAPLAEQLRVHAELLRHYAADLLAGDMSQRDRLRRVRADLAREENKARFGTSTGETPRFDARPSLEALFADVTNDGMREPRAYQALWDYGYSLDDVARFLGVGQGDVQAMLDRWERL